MLNANERRLRWLPYAVLLAEVLVFYRRVLFTSQWVIPWDLQGYHLSPAFFVAKCLRAGALPLWDPCTYCGFPFLGNIQAQIFYPPALFTALLANLTGLGNLLKLLEWQIALHVFLGGVFTYWLLRRLQLSRGAALLGGTIFQLGGYFASQAQHLGAMNGGAWLPLVWLSVIVLGERFQWRWLAALAVSLAMAILAGFPAVSTVVFVSCGLLALALVVLRKAPVKLLAMVLLAGLWAGLLSAIQLLPTLELIGLSTAADRGQYAAGGGIPLRGLASMLIPDFNGVFDLKHYSLPWNPTFLYLYCGIPGLVLGLIGVVFSRHRLRLAMVVVTLLAALWMLGESTPVGQALFSRLPEAAKAPLYYEFAMVSFVLGVAVLAALGAERLFERASRALWAVLVLVAALDLIVAGSGRPMNTAALNAEPSVSSTQFEGSQLTLERVRELVNQTVPPARIDVFQDSANWSRSAAMLEVPTANGDDPLALKRLLQVRRLFAKGPPWLRYWEVSELDSPLLDLLNVLYLLSWAPSEELIVRHPKFPKVAGLPGHHVYENRSVLPRFFLVSQVLRVKSREEALAVLGSRSFDPHRTAVVEGAVELPATGDAGPARPVRVLEYGRRRVGLEVDSPAPAFLVSSEVYYPGWRAFVDGREAPLVMTNAAFRGLAVPEGRHRVTMRFTPLILGYGLALSLIGWGGLAWALGRRAT